MNAYLNIDHVGITFPTDKGPLEVLKDVNLKLEEGEFVSHAYHCGADCYWIDGEHPWFARPVTLTDEGVVVEGRVLEHLLAS